MITKQKRDDQDTSTTRKLITISIPIYNEEGNLNPLLERLDALDKAEPGYNFEFLFTDNASTDNGFNVLAKLALTDKRIRVLKFSRNFGFQKSVFTNYCNARGDAAVQLDADLQDPPEMISDFLRKWEEDYKVVYGIRQRRKESALMNGARRAYYQLVTWLSQTELPRNAGDFRLIDRVIIDHLKSIDDQSLYIRGAIASLGYPQIGINYDRESRKIGVSKFSMFQLLEFGMDGITSQSVKPLRLMTFFGLLTCILTVFAGVFYFVAAFANPQQTTNGFTTIVLLLLLLIGLNSFFLGLLGEYVGRIFNNTRGLPLTIIEDRIDHPNTLSEEE